MKKKAMSSTAVNLIILVVIVAFLIIFSAKIFIYANNQKQISTCSLGTITTNGADAIKKTGFFTSYEINCKAMHYIFTNSLLQPNSVPAEAAQIESVIARESRDDTDRMQLVLKDKIAEELEACWKMTGNRRLISDKTLHGWYTSGTKWDDNRVKEPVERFSEKTKFFGTYFGLAYPEVAEKNLVTCMICSTNHFASDVNLPATINLKAYLEKKTFTGGNATLWTILSAKKNDHPVQEINGQVDNSVIFYQWFETPSQVADLSRLGVMVLPTEKIPTFCDVMLNRG